MPRYKVTLQEIVDYEVEVEASDETAAVDAAEQRFITSTDISEFPCVVHVREVAGVEVLPLCGREGA